MNSEPKTSKQIMAARFREEIKRCRLTIQEVADSTFLSKSSVESYVGAANNISVNFLSRAAALGIDVQYVITGIASSNRHIATTAARVARRML